MVILGGMASNTPTITDISPDHGAKGEYITIRGKNFGSQQGVVWFKYNGVDEYDGDFNFPADCKTSVWSDKQIIVKFPSSAKYRRCLFHSGGGRRIKSWR